eukprot:scaffold41022_cov67-Phaeocystis_antarctica.AAC.5
MCAITRSCAAAAADMPAGRGLERSRPTSPGVAFPCLMEPKVVFARSQDPQARPEPSGGWPHQGPRKH